MGRKPGGREQPNHSSSLVNMEPPAASENQAAPFTEAEGDQRPSSGSRSTHLGSRRRVESKAGICRYNMLPPYDIASPNASPVRCTYPLTGEGMEVKPDRKSQPASG